MPATPEQNAARRARLRQQEQTRKQNEAKRQEALRNKRVENFWNSRAENAQRGGQSGTGNSNQG